MNTDITEKPWHIIRTDTYSTKYYKLEDALFYFLREHHNSKPINDIDAFSNFWCLALVNIKENHAAISRKGKLNFHSGSLCIFCPPFSLVNWHINPGEIKWHGFISDRILPDTLPKTPILFPWNKTIPKSYNEIINIIKSTIHYTEIDKIEEPSGIAFKTKKFIDNHFTEDLSISDISNALKISHPVMTRLFKKSFSLSPLEYRNKLRIFEAQKLFLITPCKIDKTRRATGFKDQTSFYRNFKQNTLVSPKVFSQS